MMWSWISIQVVVQPQSVIHSMVEFKDGADDRPAWNTGYAACRSSMRFIIQTEDILRENGLILRNLDRSPLKNRIWRLFWDFRWQCRHPGEGGSMPTVFNAANELCSKEIPARVRSGFWIFMISSGSLWEDI